MLCCGLFELLPVEDERPAEILLADNGVGRQFLRGALEKDFPFKKKICAVGDSERLLRVVVGDENTDVF